MNARHSHTSSHSQLRTAPGKQRQATDPGTLHIRLRPQPRTCTAPSKAASCASVGLKVTPAALTSWREEPCQVAKATPAIYDIRGLRSLVLRGLERFKFLSAKVNGNSTFSSLCWCPPGLGMKSKGLWWGSEGPFANGTNACEVSFPLSSPVSLLSASPLASLSWGASPSGISAMPFSKSPLLQRSLCTSPAVSLSHQRHLFPLIPHSLLSSSSQALCSSDLLQHSSICLPFTFFVPYSFSTSSYSSIPPFPHFTLYSLRVAFSVDLLFRNTLSFLSIFCVALNSCFISFSQFFINHPSVPSLPPFCMDFLPFLLHIPHVMHFSTPYIYCTQPLLPFWNTVLL
ncbi:uncharacterized protein LOC117797284 [Ailuropoda melanoleuca]|uniref:uncharacterized protein LOC117797284 n=1 Tax=Ailuropoda melanoleuca TaxID=9646 RepID=UPI0014940F64|nr:uncharacterized protein LOC117797284 [Ailuropoda melanoleuca]